MITRKVDMRDIIAYDVETKRFSAWEKSGLLIASDGNAGTFVPAAAAAGVAYEKAKEIKKPEATGSTE